MPLLVPSPLPLLSGGVGVCFAVAFASLCRRSTDLALAGDFHNTVPDDERRDSFIAAATPASGEAQLDVDEFCAYVRANTARYTRSWSDDRGANVV